VNDRSPLRQFVTVARDFGFGIAMKAACSKLRGVLWPASRLADAPIYNAAHREVSVLLSTTQHDAATVDAVVEVLAARGGADWEVCICEHAPVGPETARVLGRHRGTQPWIRIVTTDQSVNAATAARWTVEQATGQFVAVVTPGYQPPAGAIGALVARLRNDSAIGAAALMATGSGSDPTPSPLVPADCRLLLQRKSGYLAACQGRWPLTASALANVLDAAGVPIAYIQD
jgi:hypothetical protein